ncbi:Adaptor protein complex 4 subunit epsilon [Guillardia theta CCMP2712]|uniref:Adaptor protein complex 4 subunit epsilon n=1 Tax=Guillardia theta (strain CCMP2712) TaxID=905079 RepID=L1JY49_GUITC|nr:Adaptor protein complex 4 subunit epsilon [Guillardia theta CCMP2712]EKX53145.1 Adaptor protein complex 4 subunit epsilon [Guillardia theta CCMP2712]|eukprot:XP_005840125.1 Adaptor protein complex 4 subunit epsilon [Guillardia theta CCMP2712]
MSSHSREFMDLVRAIGDCKSKQEEDNIILKEVVTLRQRLTERDSQQKMREMCMRMMYCEMLGHRVEFGYIHAVNMTQRTSLSEKRTGYLSASLFLDSDSELLILLVNTIQRDLKSQNPWEICAALSAVTRLIGIDTIPAVLKLVKDCMSHKEAHVRKKAIMALHRFLEISPSAVEDCIDVFKRSLSDRDPSVMGAGLCGLLDLAKKNPAGYTSIVPSLVVILKQIVEHRLPRDYDYHRMPAPWLQTKILKLLAVLGHANQKVSEEMYEVLRETMARADLKTTIGYAVIFECIKTITKIYPQPQLLALAAENTSLFISSENRNLRYIGVDALSAIVQVNMDYAKQHQMVVIECLEDNDITLKYKTLDLLFRMTNSANVEVVVSRMTNFLKATSDDFLIKDLVSKIIALAEKYAPSNEWYIQTMNTVFEQGGDLVPAEVAHNLMRLVAEGPSGSEEQDNELRRYATKSYFKLLPKQNTSDRLIQVGSWSLGEYAYLLSPEITLNAVVDMMCDLLQRNYYQDRNTKSYIVSAITKLVSQMSEGCPESTRALIESYTRARDPGLQQRSLELMQLMKSPEFMRRVLPVDASCEDIEVEEGLPFLDSFVQAAVISGASKYMSEAERRRAFGTHEKTAVQQHAESKLRFDAYEKPQVPSAPRLPSATTVTQPVQQSPVMQAAETPQSVDMNALFAGLSSQSSVQSLQAAPAAPPSQPPSSTPMMNLDLSLSGEEKQSEPALNLLGRKDGGKWGSGGYSKANPAMAPSFAPSSTPANDIANRLHSISASATLPPAAAVRKEPAVDTHKQQLAASIFGGLTEDPAPRGENRSENMLSDLPDTSKDAEIARRLQREGSDFLRMSEIMKEAPPQAKNELLDIFSSGSKPEVVNAGKQTQALDNIFSTPSVSKEVDLLSMPAQSSDLLGPDLISTAPTSHVDATSIYGDVSQTLSSIYSSNQPASIYAASPPVADLLSGPPPSKPSMFDGLSTQPSVAPSLPAANQTSSSSIYSSNLMGPPTTTAPSSSGLFGQMTLAESSTRAPAKEINKAPSNAPQSGPFDDILVSKASQPKVKTTMGLPSDSYLSSIHRSSSGLEVKAISKSTGDNHVLLLTHFCNLGDEDLNVDVAYLIPSGLHCSYGGDPYPAITGDVATLPMLKYGAAASHLITVMETPKTADPKNLEIGFKLKISKNGVPEEEIVQVPINLFSYALFLQPKVMSEQEFGASWAPHRFLLVKSWAGLT